MAAPTDPDPRQRRRNIKYHLDQGGPVVRAHEDSDNPLSPNFMPLAERSERGRARWWALRGRKKRQETAELDG